MKYHVRNTIIAAVFIAMVLLAGNRMYAPLSKQAFLHSKEAAVASQAADDPLYKEIKQQAGDLEEPAEDARIDSVWKKTPGRNGLKIDLPASYKRMKETGKYDADLLVKNEIAPKKGLQDLPPAPIYRGHPEKEMVALMINVSWGTEYIPKILKTLKAGNVKATFFLDGKWAKEHADYVQMIADEGHLIGSHAYNHPDMARLTASQMKEQIAKTNTILEAMTNKKPKWFAPPSGSFNDKVVEVADGEGMYTILWTVDTIDWKNPTVSVMLQRVTSKLHKGATILMHPTRPVAEGLSQMIKEIKQKGYRLNTVETLMRPER